MMSYHLLLQLNVRYKTRVAVKFTGLPEGARDLGKKPSRAEVASSGGAADGVAASEDAATS